MLVATIRIYSVKQRIEHGINAFSFTQIVAIVIEQNVY